METEKKKLTTVKINKSTERIRNETIKDMIKVKRTILNDLKKKGNKTGMVILKECVMKDYPKSHLIINKSKKETRKITE